MEQFDLIKFGIRMLLAFTLFVMGKRIIANKDPWQERIIWVVVNAIMLFVFLWTEANVTTLVKDIADNILDTKDLKQALLTTVIVWAGISYMIWYMIDRVIIPEKSPADRYLLSAGLRALSVTFLYVYLEGAGVKSVFGLHEAELKIFYFVLLGIIAVNAIGAFRCYIQQRYANMLAVIVLAVTGLAIIEMMYGIAVIEKFKSDGLSSWLAPAIIIFLAGFVSLIYSKEKPWNRRITYFLCWIGILIFISVAGYKLYLFSTGQSMAQVDDAIKTENAIQIRVCEAAIKALEDEVIHGLTYQQAEIISKEKNHSEKELIAAIKRIRTFRAGIEAMPEECKKSESTLDLMEPIYKGSTWIKEKAVLINLPEPAPFTSPKPETSIEKDESPVQAPQTSRTVVYSPGIYTIHLEQGETIDHWITFPSDRRYDGRFKSENDNFNVILDNGEVYYMKGSVIIPHQKRLKMKFSALDEPQTITFQVL
jgi:hypothetical protein